MGSWRRHHYERERAELSYADPRRRVEVPRGGHFIAAEEPALLAGNSSAPPA